MQRLGNIGREKSLENDGNDMLRHATTQSTTTQRLKETQSFGRRAVSTPRGLGTSGDAAPAAAAAAARALKRPRTVAQARPRRRPKPGPSPEPNSDPNLGSGQRASADWLALARLRPLMSTVLQSIQLRSCTLPTRSEEGSAWVHAHNRARFAIEKKSMVSGTQAQAHRNSPRSEIVAVCFMIALCFPYLVFPHSHGEGGLGDVGRSSRFLRAACVHMRATHTPPLAPPPRALATPLTTSSPHLLSPTT